MASARRRSLEQRLYGDGPKRVLALDGGGVRGILAAGILQELERRLARRSNRPDFRLYEYFDLIGGTSTGAILAAGLAMGKTCAECADLYRDIAPEVFPSGAGMGIRKPRFDSARLEAALTRGLGDYELSSPALKTGLAIFAKRVDTGSVWSLSNNPRSVYYDGGADGSAPNKRLMIRKLVQASAAAPSYFDEVKIALAQDGAQVPNAEGVFVDGAVGGLNNPSLQLLKMATMKSYGFGWATGEDRLLMVSVGTGYWRPTIDSQTFANTLFDEIAPTAARAIEALKAMIHDSSLSAVATLQGLARTPRPWRIDSETGDMRGDQLSPFPLLSFQRLDARLDKGFLAGIGIAAEDDEIAAMRELASGDPQALARLYEIGLRTGQYYFRNWSGQAPANWEEQILPPKFDPPFFADKPPGDPRNRLDALGRLFKPGAPQTE